MHPDFFDPQSFQGGQNIVRRNWRVSAFPPLTLSEAHLEGENILPLHSLRLASVNASCCVLPSLLFANTRDEFWDCQDYRSNRSLQLYRLELLFVQKIIERGCFVFFCCRRFSLKAPESVWKVHSLWRELLIFHHPVCVAGDASPALRKTNPWTIAFSEQALKLGRCDSYLRNLKISLTDRGNC